jgi:hypothetical protein
MNNWLRPILAIPTLCVCLSAQVDETAYPLRQLNQILQERKACASPEVDINVCMEIHKYQSRMTYLGEFRSITGRKAELLAGLQIAWKAQPNIVQFYSMYHQEMLVSFGGRDIWIPVQDSLVPEVKKFLKPKQEFIAYLVVPGTLKSELIFVLTRFDELD